MTEQSAGDHEMVKFPDRSVDSQKVPDDTSQRLIWEQRQIKLPDHRTTLSS